MMIGKVFVWLLAAFLLRTFSFAEAQQPVKNARVGYLGNSAPPADLSREEAFLQGLREQGWIEGRNIVIERRYWANRAERLPDLADEMVKLNLDVIVTTSGTAARAVKTATRTVPIVMLASADAVSQGLVASLARPGGNITGLTNISTDLAGKQLELLKEAFPKITRIAVLSCSGPTASFEKRWSETNAAARMLAFNYNPSSLAVPTRSTARCGRQPRNALKPCSYMTALSFLPKPST
jgi:putative ABC transport system substrate-binding protein